MPVLYILKPITEIISDFFCEHQEANPNKKIKIVYFCPFCANLFEEAASFQTAQLKVLPSVTNLFTHLSQHKK